MLLDRCMFSLRRRFLLCHFVLPATSIHHVHDLIPITFPTSPFQSPSPVEHFPSAAMAALIAAKACQTVSRVGVARLSTSAICNGAVSKIGHREVVGHGFNGEASYIDRADFPFPAVRFREPSAEFKALLEKEKGDWKSLSVEEKKALYRFSFCQTLSELKAPTGEWKFCAGVTLMLSSLALWIYIWMKLYVYSPLPESTKMERQEKQLRRMLDLRSDPIDGISSKWDYENNRWK